MIAEEEPGVDLADQEFEAMAGGAGPSHETHPRLGAKWSLKRPRRENREATGQRESGLPLAPEG
ncbi:MAG: hypothetical protein QM767_11335 [Anaeromyxobacter sp.]